MTGQWNLRRKLALITQLMRGDDAGWLRVEQSLQIGESRNTPDENADPEETPADAPERNCLADNAKDSMAVKMLESLLEETLTERTEDDILEQPTDNLTGGFIEEPLTIPRHVMKSGCNIASHVLERITAAKSTTERAALSIGNHVSALFDIADEVNNAATRSLARIVGGTVNQDAGEIEDEEKCVVQLIRDQQDDFGEFVDLARSMLNQQAQLTLDSQGGLEGMRMSVRQIDKMVLSSQILAINIQIESARLGDNGLAFSVLGNQMLAFSTQIKEANEAIQKANELLVERMHHMQSETTSMNKKLSTRGDRLSTEMTDIGERTRGLTDSLTGTLNKISSSNQALMSHSQSALSALQFQDPLSQDLMRTAHEVEKIRSLISEGSFEDTDLAEIDPVIGHDGSLEREAGLVELF